MGVPTTVGDVVAYLVREVGFKQEFAQRICNAHEDVIQQGMRLGSYTYFIGSAVVRAEYGTEEVPQEHFDPHWVEPAKELDEDDRSGEDD